MDIGQLVVRLAGNNSSLRAAFAEGTAQSDAFAARMEANGARSSGAIRAVGLAFAAVSVGIVAFGAEAAKQATTFQSNMELIRTQAGATQAEVTAMSSAVLGLAPETGTGPEELAAALYHLESAGFRGEVALNALRIAAEGAKVGHANLEDVTNTLDAVLVAGGKDATNLAGAMGQLNAIVGAGDMRMQDLADAMGTGILAAAHTFGLSLKDIGGALATMGDNNIRGADAATKLRMAISLMGAPSGAAVKALKSIGIGATELNQDMQKLGLTGALTDLKNHLDHLSFATVVKQSGESAAYVKAHWASVLKSVEALDISRAFGGGKSSTAIQLLLQQLDRLKSKTGEIGGAVGSFAADWAATEATTAVQGQKVAASFDSITLAIGTALLPAVNSLLSAVLPVITQIAQWTVANPQLAVQILAVTAAVSGLIAVGIFLGPILAGIGTLVGVITSPILLLIGGIAALAAHFGLLGKGAQDAVDGILARVQAAVPGIIATVGQLASQFLAWIEPMIPPALAALGNFAGEVIGWIGDQIPVVAAQLLTWADAFVAWVEPMIPPALGALGDFASQVISWIAAQLPVWGAQLLQWADAFIGWVAPMIPPFLGALGQFGAAAIGWIIRQIPVVAAALGRLAIEFVAWVLPKIPSLLVALGQFALSLLGWLAGEIPVLDGALLDWGAALIGWVVDSIPGLMANLGNWFAQVLAWASGLPAQIYNAFLGFGQQIAKGIVDGIGDIAKAVGDKLNTIPGVSLVGGVVSFGGSVVSNTIGGVAQVGSNIVNTVTGSGAASAPPSTAGQAIPGGAVREYALGGVVPGGPGLKQLAYVHGGETIVPPGGGVAGPGLPARGGGQGGGPVTIVLEHHTHVDLDGHEIADFIDRKLFQLASGFSSGFQANPGITGA